MKLNFCMIVIISGCILLSSIYFIKISDYRNNNPIEEITDDVLLEVYKRWENGEIHKESDLVKQLGAPDLVITKNGVTTYEWYGSEKRWLYASISLTTGTVTGITVLDSYL